MRTTVLQEWWTDEEALNDYGIRKRAPLQRYKDAPHRYQTVVRNGRQVRVIGDHSSFERAKDALLLQIRDMEARINGLTESE